MIIYLRGDVLVLWGNVLILGQNGWHRFKNSSDSGI
jgi:hypothetical protein